MSSVDEKNADITVGHRSPSSDASTANPNISIEAAAGANGEVDQAWKFLNDNRDAAAVNETEGIDMLALRRKIDLRVVPLLFLCYTMQFLDKVILNVCAFSAPQRMTDG